jgi:hypothetical protein
MDAKGLEETADVVPDCLGAQVELVSDLFRRAPMLQETKHLDLTRGEVRGRRCGCFVGVLVQEAEDADHPFTAHQRHRADLHRDPRTDG